MATLTLEGVSSAERAAGRRVDEVDLDIADGAFAVLLGPTGSGKATLLRLVAGLERIGAGTLMIDGRPANAVAPGARDIAMVFQDDALYPHMTVQENLAFGLANRGERRQTIEVKVAEAAEALGVADVLRQRPCTLSAGQRRRAALARAMVRSPKLFLFDEPLDGLDTALKAELKSEIKRLHKELGVTMLFATHDPTEAMALGDQVALLQEGRIVQSGTPEALYQKPATRFVAEFIGMPQINILPCDVRQGAVWFGDVGFAHLDRVDGTSVSIGVRPEHFKLREVGSSPLGGVVEAVEFQGADAFVRVGILKHRENHRVIVRVAPEQAPEEGIGVGVDMTPGKAMIFDENGSRVSN